MNSARNTQIGRTTTGGRRDSRLFGPALALALVTALAVAGGTAADGPAFEVAIIKPSLPLSEALPLIRQGKLRVGINVDKALADVEFQSLKDLVGAAYKVKPFQIAGPAWLADERFDIQAKLPAGASLDQVPHMMQVLLAERFGMTVHSEPRDVPVYALMAGAGGIRIKESEKGPDDQETADASVKSEGQLRVSATRDGAVVSGPGYGGIATSTTAEGVHLVMTKSTMASLATVLTKFAGRPVVDRTGLPGRYDLVLDLPMAEVAYAARSAGAGLSGDNGADAGASDPGSSLFRSMEVLGLKLKSARDRAETIVVDHIEKKPTDN